MLGELAARALSFRSDESSRKGRQLLKNEVARRHRRRAAFFLPLALRERRPEVAPSCFLFPSRFPLFRVSLSRDSLAGTGNARESAAAAAASRTGPLFGQRQQYPNSKTDGSRLEGKANTRTAGGSMKGTRIAATAVIKEPDRVNVIHVPPSVRFSFQNRTPR